MDVASSHTYYNAWVETPNEIELTRTRYEVAPVDQGYHVYAAVWEAAIGQILLCDQEGGKIHDPYVVTVAENNDTPIDSDKLVLNMKISWLKLS